ncbi:hypothetical protein M0804_015281, partial [Polistes exclamans]
TIGWWVEGEGKKKKKGFDRGFELLAAWKTLEGGDGGGDDGGGVGFPEASLRR